MKALRIPKKEKFFLNVCHSDGIPTPEDISVHQLTSILQSATPSTYKVPMSITELRITKDKKKQDVLVCDVAINPAFFRKVELATQFRDFLMTIVFEALDAKYNVKLDADWVILKNRKCLGNLVSHRIQNRDARQVIDSYQNMSKADKTLLNENYRDDLEDKTKAKPKIQVITNGTTRCESNNNMQATNESEDNKQKPNENKNDRPNGSYGSSSNQNGIAKDAPPSKKPRSKAKIGAPEYTLFQRKCDENRTELVTEIHIPGTTDDQFTLDVNHERIHFSTALYELQAFLPYDIDNGTVAADWDAPRQVLTVTMVKAGAC